MDGLYSSAMTKALTKALQKAVGAVPDGEFGQETYTKCRQLALKTGSAGNAVRILQAFLVCLR